IALAMAAAGADVLLTFRTSAERARQVAESIAAAGRRAVALPFDLADAASIAALATSARDAFGRVDVWINNAGADILTGAAASLSRLERLDLLLTNDLRGTMLASWQAVELMSTQREGGVIINMSWDHVLVGMAGTNPQMFSAAKGGVLSFSKSLARSVAPRIRVNILAPGWIETTFIAGLDEERRREIAESTPMKRIGTPADVAAAAVFLASPGASFLTGQTMFVGGGTVT
ncbi:MAG TPA: SDR family oxidoreductase, partial [Gemmatimonadaceae bacterium]|nr:SDR family oxidoreductase [Gemmatimonadaceae bacterium]